MPHLLALLAILHSPVLSATDLSPAINSQLKVQKQSIQSQNKINKLDDEAQLLLEEYRSTLDSIEELKAYNKQLARQVADQNEALLLLEEKRRDVEKTQRNIVPLMVKMLDVFGKFVELDAPFLPEERQMRFQQLQLMMDQADVSLAEKYRRLLEAYRVEAEYGHTLEAYQGELKNGRTRTVEFLRLGRVGLYYLTLDGNEAGIWSQKDRGWQKLDSRYVEPIKQGLLIARKQLPPNLIRLPLQNPEVSK